MELFIIAPGRRTILGNVWSGPGRSICEARRVIYHNDNQFSEAFLEPVYLDNHLLVVNKPAGMLSQADRTGDRDVLTHWKEYVRSRFNKPGNVYLGLVHRLDRPASGLMVLARTSKAAQRLSRQFREREVIKEYVALVEGCIQTGGIFEDYLLKEGRTVRLATESESGSQYAKMDVRPINSEGALSLVSVMLETGRPHQIRLQLSSRDYPILGDFRYGASAQLDGKNIALHSFRLAFEHPVKKTMLTWTVPPPETWPSSFRKAILSDAACRSDVPRRD